MNNRLYFFADLDGTLLHKTSSHLYPNIKNEHVIQNYTGAGNAFIMATGRGYRDIQTVAKNLNIPTEYAITNNGAMIYKNGNEIFSSTITSDQIDHIIATADSTNIKYNQVMLFTENSETYIKGHNFFGTIRRIGSAVKNKRKIKVWKENTIDKLLKRNLRFPKICFIIYNREAVVKLEDKLKAAFGNQLSIYCSSPFCLEICDADVDKANAIKLIMKRENLAMDQVAFVGDSGNDVCAFEQLEHTYVMDHANKRYKMNGTKAVDSVADAILDFTKYHRTQEEQDVAGIDD